MKKFYLPLLYSYYYSQILWHNPNFLIIWSNRKLLLNN